MADECPTHTPPPPPPHQQLSTFFPGNYNNQKLVFTKRKNTFLNGYMSKTHLEDEPTQAVILTILIKVKGPFKFLLRIFFNNVQYSQRGLQRKLNKLN